MALGLHPSEGGVAMVLINTSMASVLVSTSEGVAYMPVPVKEACRQYSVKCLLWLHQGEGTSVSRLSWRRCGFSHKKALMQL